MGAHNGAVQHDIFHIRVEGKVLMHFISDAMLTPTGKALVDRVPVPVALGQEPPLRAAARDPQHSLDKETAIDLIYSINPRMVV